MKKIRRGWVRILVIFSAIALLGGGAYFVYQRLSGGDKSTVYVQSVASITGTGYVGLLAQYNGIVEAKDVVEINPSGSMPVKECYVVAGSHVNAGDPLFCYDVEDLKLQYAQIQIDITGVQNNLRTYRDRLDTLKKQLSKLKETDSERYQIELEIQTIELDIKKAEYDLSDKQRRASEMQKLIDASEVNSPVTGTVRSVRDDSGTYDPFGYGSGGSSAYITIIAGTAYCVKGTVNEQTIHTLYVGMPVLIRSRVDDTVYHGTIYRINTDAPENDQSGYYYDGGERASKYAFYVEPDTVEGLLMGQHVLIDLNTDTSTVNGLMLPASFLFEEGGNYYAWAADENGRIEKRSVIVDAYFEETESFKIVKGLTLRDRIAFPDETIRAGMLADETVYNDPAENGGGPAFQDGGEPALQGGMEGGWEDSDDGLIIDWNDMDEDWNPDDSAGDGFGG